MRSDDPCGHVTTITAIKTNATSITPPSSIYGPFSQPLPLYLAMTNTAAINIGVLLCEHKFLFHLHKYLGVVLLGHQIVSQSPKSRVSLDSKFV